MKFGTLPVRAGPGSLSTGFCNGAHMRNTTIWKIIAAIEVAIAAAVILLDLFITISVFFTGPITGLW